jgi:two-component sensor histidine kinase
MSSCVSTRLLCKVRKKLLGSIEREKGTAMGVTNLVAVPAKPDKTSPLPAPSAIDRNICGICDLALEADHRIANHLTMLHAHVRLRESDLTNHGSAPSLASVKLAFDGIRSQIDAISRLHRALVSPQRGVGVNLGEYLHSACAPFMSGLSGNITLSEDLHPDCIVKSDHVLPITQIVSEVVTNAVKYSHATDETGNIHVRCAQFAVDQVEIEIYDDGHGLPVLFDPGAASGLGFRLVRALAAQIGAKIGFDSTNRGLRFWLRLAAAESQAPQTSA